MIAWAEKDTTKSEKYGPRKLYFDVFQRSGMIRFVEIAPAPPSRIPSRR
jgi:hypothetical protein